MCRDGIGERMNRGPPLVACVGEDNQLGKQILYKFEFSDINSFGINSIELQT